MIHFNKMRVLLWFFIIYPIFLKTTVVNHLKDIVLIVNFNHPFYDNISFLKELYSPIFENILFYGEKEGEEVHQCVTNTGYILAPVIQDACTRFPHAKGYLFLQDDCVLHWWNLLSLNPTKIWYAVKFNDGLSTNDKFYSIRHTNGSHLGGYSWGKWDYGCGLNAAVKAANTLNASELSLLRHNLGAVAVAAHMCEVFYIPQHLKDNFLKLNSSFKDVFCEIAVPTMLCCLDSLSNWEHLEALGGAGVGIGTPGSPMLVNYPKHISWIHPVKFSYHENRDRISKIFEEMLSAHA